MRKILKTLTISAIIASTSLFLGAQANSLPSEPFIGPKDLPVYNNGTNVNVTTNNANMNIKINGGANSVGTANWDSFNIGKDAKVNVQFTAQNQTSLNRVAETGGMSHIYGKFTNSGYSSTGKVILLNPNGILFGSGANVNLNSFTASSLNGTYNSNKRELDLKNKENFSGPIVIEENAKIHGDNSVALISDRIYANKGSLISTGKNGFVKLVTTDGVNFTYTTQGKINSIDKNVQASSGYEYIGLHGDIKAGYIYAKNSSYNDKSELAANNAVLNAEDGNIYLISNNNLEANGNKLSAKNNVTIDAERQLNLDGNKINATNGQVTVHSYLDEMSVSNNNIVAKNNINVTSDTNTLNLTNNTIKSSYGNVNLKADENDNYFNFALNAERNKITANKDINLTARNVYLNNVYDEKGQAIVNTVKSTNGNVYLKANNELKSAASNIEAKKDINIIAKNTTLWDDKIKSTNGKVNVNTSNKLNARWGTISSKGNVDIEAKDADFYGYTLNSTSKDININADDSFYSFNGNKFTAKNNVNLNSKNVTLYADVKSNYGNVNINASNELVALDSKITAKNNVNMSAKNIELLGNNIKSTNGYINVKADNKLKLADSVSVASCTDCSYEPIYTYKSNILSAKKDTNLNAKSASLANSTIQSTSGNVNIDTVRQLNADNNTIKATNGQVELHSYLDEMSVINNKITAKNDVNITSDTNTLNFNGNTVNSSKGSVNIAADKEAWGKMFGIDFKLNANNNKITAKNDVNVTAKNIDATTNKISANNDVNIKATDNIIARENKFIAKKDININAKNSSINENTIKANNDVNVKMTQKTTGVNNKITAGYKVNLKNFTNEKINEKVYVPAPSLEGGIGPQGDVGPGLLSAKN